MKTPLCLVMLFILLTPHAAVCEPIALLYPNRPPFNYTVGGKAAGSLVELTERIFTDAGLDFVFIESPAKRVFHELRQAGNASCAFGVLKNEERKAFGTYTLPIIQDTPLVALSLKKHEKLFPSGIRLKDLVSMKELTLGLILGWSYGNYVDGIIRTAHVPVMGIPERRSQALMLANDRMTYTLVRQMEIDEIIALTGKPRENFLVVPLADLQDQSKRYILCGKGVPEDVIAKLNASITKLCDVRE